MADIISNAASFLISVFWGPVGCALLFAAGLVMSIRTKGFQFSHFGLWIKSTIGAIFTNKQVTSHTGKTDKAISQFQSLCTALAATIGTGNIVGVAGAILSGGPGAIFWMWIMAILGMMTNYSENVLGIFFRRKNEAGEWSGGAMYYLKDGLGAKEGCKKLGKFLGALFAIFCVVASFGIGNVSQVNSISGNLNSAFGVPTWVTGIAVVILSALVIVGGLKRVAAVAEKLIPFMAIAYLVGSFIVIGVNINLVPAAFAAIFENAFGFRSVGGAVVGYSLKVAIEMGCKRGAFSNEAGLGSSVMVHSNSNVREPVQQGMWGIFEVFMDTIIVCTVTAIVVLTSGFVDLKTGAVLTDVSSSALVGAAFGEAFGSLGPKFIAVAILLFAYSTVLGWSHYGAKSFEYLFGTKASMAYKAVFVLMSYFSATMDLQLAWDISDAFNGMMMVPNLIGVLTLSGTVAAITKNYIDRKVHGKDIKPMYSFIEKYQAEAEEAEKVKA